ncbi:MAG: CoA transferase [Gammaproteobacteria bacterium]|nr:CoA transferase [Gammaproteobacteria bacterium]
MDAKLPLEGIRVIEMGSSIAGPYAALILSDMGAEVLKVEHPQTGDTSRAWGRPYLDGKSAVFETMNRGKKSITVDMRDAQDVAVLRALIIESVDVVLQNLRPGSVDEFGLDAATLLAEKPELIYCNSGAFGANGPFSDRPGYDPLMQGFSGLASITGEADGGPCRVGSPVVDFGTGMWNAIGILGLLSSRAHTGHGGVVDSSLFDTAAAWMTLHTGLLQANGHLSERSGLRGPMLAPNSGYACSDGLLMIVCATETQFRNMCSAIDAPHLLEDPRFATAAMRNEDHDNFERALNAHLQSGTRAHWGARLDGVKVPNAPVQSLQELMDHEQTAASEMLQTGPIDGFRAMTLPLRFNGRRPAYAAAAPQLGEHNDQKHKVGTIKEGT